MNMKTSVLDIKKFMTKEIMSKKLNTKISSYFLLLIMFSI